MITASVLLMVYGFLIAVAGYWYSHYVFFIIVGIGLMALGAYCVDYNLKERLKRNKH